MSYSSLEECILDLERNGQLIRIKEEVDPHLEMAAIHLRVFENNGPAILFENVKGSPFKAVSNLFGTLDRSKFIFRDTLEQVKKVVELKNDPIKAIKSPFKNIESAFTLKNALPQKSYKNPVLFAETTINQLPQIQCWPNDGGAFVTLPQVYTEDIDNPGIMNSNLGMYRIQLSGNDYVTNKEIGLHYQIHRGIGVHQTKAYAKNKPLKVSIFVGGPPAHSLAAVMPLPEGISELTFAGALGKRRFRHTTIDGFRISSDADFVITGEVYPNEIKPEGPFGDHLGYYSLTHPFPVLKIHKVFHRKNAIWPFTVVGRPPQEDTQFGALIHEITGDAIPNEIPGLHEINAVDAAGVHPLLLAIGSERYTPYENKAIAQEVLTIANHILGTGQLSLAKYLFITNKADNPNVTTHNIEQYFKHVLERIDLSRDLHFYTKTTIDTLDYSGSSLNNGSKVVISAVGEQKRTLGTELNSDINVPSFVSDIKVVLPGILSIALPQFTTFKKTKEDINDLSAYLKRYTNIDSFPFIVLCDDADFVAQTLNNFLWITFTRSNPSTDIYGINETTIDKHWSCEKSLIIDARIKPHHAPPLILDPEIEKRVDKLGEKNNSLFGII